MIKTEKSIKFTVLIVLLSVLNACSRPFVKETVNKRTGDGLYLKNVVLDKDTSWEGTVIIDRLVVIRKNTTLAIKPGTVIKFVFWDEDGDNIGNSKLVVKGRIVAEGTDAQPIIFTSNEKNKKPGDWYSVQMLSSNDNIFKYCHVEYSVAGFEAECSSGFFSHNIFTDNIRGMRFARCKFTVQYSIFKNNTYGLWFCDIPDKNYEKSASDIHHNTITKNKFGIFCKYNSPNTRVTNNNIFDNLRYNVSFSMWVYRDLNAGNNFWGETTEEKIMSRFFDQRRDESLGRVLIDPYLLKKIDISE